MHNKVLDIPELVSLLAAYLSPHDLLACVQVNQFWNTTFIPILWHTIDDSTPSWEYILRGCTPDLNTVQHAFWKVNAVHMKKEVEEDKGKGEEKDREWVLAVFRKYGKFIRNLSLSWPLVLEAVSMATVVDRRGGGGGSDDRWSGIESLVIAISEAHVPQGPIHDEDTVPQQTGTGAKKEEVAQELMPVSEPLFPGYLTVSDFSPPSLDFRQATKNIQDRQELGWVLGQHYWHTILRNRRTLKRLVLARLPWPQWELKSKDVYYRMIGQLKGLKELEEWRSHMFGSENAWQSEDIWRILRACPQIESLEVSGYGQLQGLELPMEEAVVNTTLRRLSVNIETSVCGLVTLLDLFPNLSTLRFAILSPIMEYRTAPSLNAHQPPRQLEQHDPLSAFANSPITRSSSSSSSPFALRSLSVHLGGDPHLILGHLPSLTELNQKEAFSKSLASALTTHCPRFEVFRWISQNWDLDTGQREDQEDATNRFFIDMASLRVFDSAWQYIRVDEMLRQQPWACLGLEWLTCRIVGIERLDDQELALVDGVLSTSQESTTGLLLEGEAAVMEKFYRCQRQHHGVYDQLSKLTRLKHLDLGHAPRYRRTCIRYNRDRKTLKRPTGTPRFDTLELSLASGLDRLAPLKDLEVFAFECVNHRIGKEELKWMAENWPKVDM